MNDQQCNECYERLIKIIAQKQDSSNDFFGTILNQDNTDHVKEVIRIVARLSKIDKKKIHTKLFSLISVDEPNEDEILEILSDELYEDSIKSVINKPADNKQAESMLMWAVWRFKTRVVLKLLELGADIEYENDAGESVSTYWDLDRKTDEKHQQLAAEMIDIIYAHTGSVNIFLDDSYNSWSLDRTANEYKLKIIQDKLNSLGMK